VDIGGGSTEVIRGSREAFKGYVSLPIGTVKLTERFVRHDPPSDTEVESLVRAVREALAEVPREACDAVVGVGGTVTTLAAIALGLPGFDKHRIEGARLSEATISGVIEQLKPLPSKERLHIPGMERGREDILLQGIILMREIMTHFQRDELIVTTKGARHGFIYEAAARQSAAS
jgi:exopolyphosphatase/guanosine-5'-triphosphate,3'-diphosphate pyrophosphatase